MLQCSEQREDVIAEDKGSRVTQAAAPVVSQVRLTRQAMQVAAALLVIYVLWGSVYVAVKVIVEAAPPLLSIGLRYVVAGLILAVVAVARGGVERLRLTYRTAAGCCVLALLLPVLTNGTVSVAESIGVPAGPAALLSAMTPIAIAALRIADGDRPRILTLAGIFVGFGGLVLLLLGGEATGGFPIGPSLLVVFSATCWAVGSFFQSRLALPRDTFVTVGYELVFGGVILTAAGLIGREHLSLDYPTKTWLVLAYLTASSTVAFVCYVWLLSNAPISLVSTHAYVNPVVAVVLAWLLLSEPISWPILAGGLVVVAAVVLVITAERVGGGRAAAPDAPPG
jgi:drug/metabolite transporter (DMT)-like permease